MSASCSSERQDLAGKPHRIVYGRFRTAPHRQFGQPPAYRGILRQQRGEFAGAKLALQAAQDGDKRREGNPALAEFRAVANQHERTGTDPACELGHQPRLPDACLPADQYGTDRWSARASTSAASSLARPTKLPLSGKFITMRSCRIPLTAGKRAGRSWNGQRSLLRARLYWARSPNGRI